MERCYISRWVLLTKTSLLEPTIRGIFYWRAFIIYVNLILFPILVCSILILSKSSLELVQYGILRLLCTCLARHVGKIGAEHWWWYFEWSVFGYQVVYLECWRWEATLSFLHSEPMWGCCSHSFCHQLWDWLGHERASIAEWCVPIKGTNKTLHTDGSAAYVCYGRSIIVPFPYLPIGLLQEFIL